MDPNMPAAFPTGGSQSMPVPYPAYLDEAVAPLAREDTDPHLSPTTAPVKHRRSRSGCLTCRARRVKCDERKPICERCRKGTRSCQYPAERAKGEASSNVPHTIHEESSSGEEDSDFKQSPPIAMVIDEDAHGDLAATVLATATMQGNAAMNSSSRTPSLTFEQSHSPSSEGSDSHARSAQNLTRVLAARTQIAARYDFSPPSLLSFFKSHITRHHYRLKNDDLGFLHDCLLEEAARFEPLNLAVLAFAAFHYSMSVPESNLQDFLKFYNESLRRLSNTLKTRKQHSVGILLTMLQLALVAEYMGDWGDLRAHKKAAQTVITALFTPKTIATSDYYCKMLEWYLRLDLSIGFISAERDTIAREWYVAAHDYFLQQLDKVPDDLSYKLEERATAARLLTCDMRRLFSRRVHATIEEQEFLSQYNGLRLRFQSWHRDTDLLKDKSKLVQSFSRRRASADDIVNPFDPNFLYGDDLFALNFLLIDIWGLELLFEYHAANVFKTRLPPSCLETALQVCQMIETIEYYSQVPGALTDNSGVLAFLPTFLPKDGRHIYWALKKLTAVEATGYIYPAFLRMRLGELWGLELNPGWLPAVIPFPGAEAAATHEPLTVPPQITRVRRFVETGDQDDPNARIIGELSELFARSDVGID